MNIYEGETSVIQSEVSFIEAIGKKKTIYQFRY